MDEDPLYLNVLPGEDNYWEAHKSWPLKDATWESWFLRSNQSTDAEFPDGHSLSRCASTAWKEEDTYLRIFGKPTTRVNRRMGVVLCYAPLDSDLDTLRDKAKRIADRVEVY